ncbi:MAG: hypothetical protein ABW046_05035 [Actinoplanes sp.]
MSQSLRSMPVRDDGWLPDDRIFDSILRRAVANAEDDAARDGTGEYMAGLLILGVLAVVIVGFAKSITGAVLVCGVLAGAGILYMLLMNKPPKPSRATALISIGGPGRLPAGYLVHPKAWEAGMAEHVAHIPESQLAASADMCHLFPGTVDDLITFTGTIAIHLPATRHASSADVQRRAHELVRVGTPILREYAKTAPPLPKPPEPGKKGKK